MRYKPNHAGMRELGKSSGVGDAALAVAKRGVEAAKGIAPEVTGGYKNSIEARKQTVQAGRSNEDRAGASYGAHVPYANAVEKRHHTMSDSVNRIRK